MVVVLGVVALGAAACSAPQDPQRGGGGGQAPVPVTIAAVVQKAVPLDFQVIGTVEAYSTVAVHAQITGQLTSVSFKEGEDVREGQVLFALDRRPLEATLQQTEANLQRDEAQLANAKAQADRYADLARRGIGTTEQADQLAASAKALQATVGADQAAIDNARVQLDYATIRAPIAGRTGALMVHAGSLVRANDTTPLVVIDQVAPIYVSFALPEAELPTLRRYMTGGTPRLDALAPDDQPPAAEGRITFVDNAVDPTTGTIRIKGEFANGDRRLWPGQFVNVSVTLATDPADIVVPSAALQTGPQGTYVFVAKADRTVDLRPVEIARTRGDETIIASGLRAGENVVTDGQIRLVPGSRIAIKTPDAAKSES